MDMLSGIVRLAVRRRASWAGLRLETQLVAESYLGWLVLVRRFWTVVPLALLLLGSRFLAWFLHLLGVETIWQVLWLFSFFSSNARITKVLERGCAGEYFLLPLPESGFDGI
jgi:hypothetical protein